VRDAADAFQRPCDLIRIKDRHLTSRIKRLDSKEVLMPFDAMLMSVAVVAMFLLFAGVVAWGDYQTRPDRLKGSSQKR
jgi:hypothetical protein